MATSGGMGTNSGIDWGAVGGDAIGAALNWYLSQQGKKTPNTYPVPLTPEDKYWDDARKNLFESGGSPDVKGIRSAGFQYLSQIPSEPSGFKFMSPHLAGQPFSGGVKVPSFSFAGMGVTGGGGTGAPSPATTTPMNRGNGPANFVGSGGGGQHILNRTWDPAGGEGGPGFGESIADYMGRNPGFGPSQYEDYFPTTGGRNDPNRPGAPGSQTQYGTGNPISTVWNAFTQFKQEHPNWAQLGVTAISAALAATIGLPGALIGKILTALLGGSSGNDGTAPLPTGRDLGDVTRGMQPLPGGGSIYAPPPGVRP